MDDTTFKAELELIETVKEYKAIYDRNSEKYKDQSIKAVIWQQIGDKLQQPPEKCKEAWTKLRNAYCNAMKRRQNRLKGYNGTNVVPPWKYDEQMSFIKQFVIPRQPGFQPLEPKGPFARTTLKLPDSFDDETFRTDYETSRIEDDDTFGPDDNTASQGHEISRTVDETLRQDSVNSDEDHIIYFDECREDANFEESKYKSRSATPHSDSSSEAQNPPEKKPNLQDLYSLIKSSHEMKQESQLTNLQDMDETDLFFLSMSKAVKKLPKIDQSKIKLDLHSAVSQAEIRELQRPAKYPKHR